MSGLFAFRCSLPGQPLAASTLVAFCGPSPFSITDLSSAVTNSTREGAPPELVWMLVPEDQASAVSAIPSTHTVWDTISAAGTEIEVVAYTPEGLLRKAQSGSAVSEDMSAAIRRQGLTTIFRNRGGMLESGASAHFVNPSGSIGPRFLHAAHALSEGAEIAFAALWLLPWMQSDVKVVHVDTSSIFSVVYAALLMRGNEPPFTIPELTTFRSYEGLTGHAFSRDRRELAIISATQSGKMAKDVAARVKNRGDVVTLFSTVDPSEGTALLCDLRQDDESNFLGYSTPSSISKRSSTWPIRLISEHFVVERRPPTSVVPTKTGAPRILDRLASVAGGGVFSALRAEFDVPQAAWVDVERLLKTDAARHWVTRDAATAIPMTTRAMIRTDESIGTRAFATALRNEVALQTGRSPDWRDLSLGDLETEQMDWLTPTSPVVVVSGATGHGRELLAASRALRDFAPESRRIYLTTIVAGATEHAISLLERNLQFGGHSFRRFLDLPVNRRRLVGSWRKEREMLQAREDLLPQVLADRLQSLLRTADGLTDNLFLSHTGSRLALRPNFAFWPREIAGCDQADVFVTIAAVLENLRTGAAALPEERLLNDTHTQSILGPEVFSRFNDGVIQASLLRAALPVEINYRASVEQSRAMAELIIQMAELQHRPQGEALAEFLLAFATDRLQLATRQSDRLIAELENRDDLPELAKWLVAEKRRRTAST